MKKVVYGLEIKRVMRSKLVLGIADGWLSADGNVIYRASDLKVGLFKQDAPMAAGGLIAARARRLAILRWTGQVCPIKGAIRRALSCAGRGATI